MLDQQITSCEQRITVWFKTNPTCQRLAQVEGIGPLTATAFVAAVANPAVFKNGRQVSAWLGLVPRQVSTGGKTVLLGISKRGDCYLRALLIHGARAVMRYQTEGGGALSLGTSRHAAPGRKSGDGGPGQ